jgi:hypothetical protein
MVDELGGSYNFRKTMLKKEKETPQLWKHRIYLKELPVKKLDILDRLGNPVVLDCNPVIQIFMHA